MDARGRFVARGLADPGSPIAVRVWTTNEAEPLDAALVRRRVEAAWALREAAVDRADTDAFRLLHGEGDRLPGLVCDLYGHSAVLRVEGPAGRLIDPVASAVKAVVPDLRRLVLRRAGRGAEDAPATHLFGAPTDRPGQVREHGMRLEVDLARGHKTGLYLDQRENRALVGRLAAGRRTLDAFAYTGGFGLAAALGGATHVTLVETAAPAIEAARRNAAANGLDPSGAGLRFVTADAFDFLADDGGTYDLVVLDPPSMAHSAATLERALGAYRRLNTLALARLAPGGILVTASCSSHVREGHLVEVLRDAAVSSRRAVRILEHRGAGPDHPVLPAFPEGRYLKVLVAWVE